MGSITPITTTNKSRSRSDDGGPRDVLREAIAARKAAAGAIEKHKGAISRARQLLRGAERKAEAAASGVGRAKAEAAKLAAAAAQTDDGDLSGGAGVLRSARAAETEALDQVEAARNALARLQTQTVQFDADLIDLDNAIQAAVLAVFAPEVRAALTRVKELDRETLPKIALIRFAQETGTERSALSPLGSAHELEMRKILDEPMAKLRAEINQLTAERRQSDEWMRGAVRTLQALRETLRFRCRRSAHVAAAAIMMARSPSFLGVKHRLTPSRFIASDSNAVARSTDVSHFTIRFFNKCSAFFACPS